jgi:Peroxiredoxin
MLEPGSSAPTFSLPSNDGTTVSLSSYRDQYVVVYFFPRADTPGCTTEACEFRDTVDVFMKHDIAVIGISDDPVSDLDAFANEYDLPFPLLSDDGTVASAYDSYGEKNMFGNTFDGVFRNTYIIDPMGTIAFAYEGVSPTNHVESIITDLDAAGVIS